VRALVTGGAGFIGHHLVGALLERGDEVAVIDDFSTGLRERLENFAPRIRLVEGDVRDAGALDAAMEGCSVVFHEAALPSVARSVQDPRLSNEVITSGTIEVMLAASRAGVRRVVLAGSSSIYGDDPELPRLETQRPNPRSPYAAGKLAAEFYLHSLGALHGVESVGLRYFNIFGPGQDPASDYAAVVPRWVTAALSDRPLVVYGDGTQSRDFTFIDNVVSANLLAAATPGVSGLTCNIGCGGRYSLLELAEAISEAVGHPLELAFAPARAGDVPHSQADISLAGERLGYRVITPFREGVRRTVLAYRGLAAGGDRATPASPAR
jgi:UDP-N-acetylglucosamine/UDP-N-acetyl-alpha-D-glucosaminouronate 4-epimerase